MTQFLERSSPTHSSSASLVDALSSTRGAPRISSGDCAICFTRVLPEKEEGGGVLAGFGRLGYMVTPCHHLFHTECLETWMDVKLEVGF